MRNLRGASDTPARAACRGLIHDNVCALFFRKSMNNSTNVQKHKNEAFCAFNSQFEPQKHKTRPFCAFDDKK